MEMLNKILNTKELQDLKHYEDCKPILETVELIVSGVDLYHAVSDGFDLGDIGEGKAFYKEFMDVYEVRKELIPALLNMNPLEVNNWMRPLSTRIDKRLYEIIRNLVSDLIRTKNNVESLIQYYKEN